MKIIIYNKNDFDKLFIYEYIPRLIKNYFSDLFDQKRLDVINNTFGINSFDIIMFALDNLKIYSQPDAYIIEIDKNLRYKNINVDSIINLITYGNRECKGYPLIYNIFKIIAENVERIYEKWGNKWR